MATHSSIPAWRIPQTETGYSQWGRKESDPTEATEHMCIIVTISKKKKKAGRVSDGTGEFNLKAQSLSVGSPGCVIKLNSGVLPLPGLCCQEICTYCFSA